MIGDSNPSDEEIVSFVDGELDADRSLAIETALIGDEKLQQRVNEFRKTRKLLIEAFAVADMETPPHIMAQIDKMDPSTSKKEVLSQDHSFLHKFFMSFRIQYAIPAAAFSLGLFLNPALIPSSNDQPVNDFLTNQLSQIKLKGPEQEVNFLSSIETRIGIEEYLNTRAIQNGVGIYSGNLLKADSEFTILFLSPFNGTATLVEKINETEEDELVSIEISNGRYTNFPVMNVTQQSSLSLIVRIQNEDIVISQTLNFNIDN